MGLAGRIRSQALAPDSEVNPVRCPHSRPRAALARSLSPANLVMTPDSRGDRETPPSTLSDLRSRDGLQGKYH